MALAAETVALDGVSARGYGERARGGVAGVEVPEHGSRSGASALIVGEGWWMTPRDERVVVADHMPRIRCRTSTLDSLHSPRH